MSRRKDWPLIGGRREFHAESVDFFSVDRANFAFPSKMTAAWVKLLEL
jgi:hypothetical protein